MSKKASEDNRARNWTFILYPESAPENWKEILQEQHLNFAVSPCHDKDINPTGEPKKAHYHILLAFDGKKSYSQVESITSSLNATIPQKVANTIGLIRYFTHLDNPEKYQYDVKDIYSYGTIDVMKAFDDTVTEDKALKEMRAYVNENNITEFSDLFDYAAEENDVWFRCLKKSSYLINQYIKSKRYKKLQQLNDILKK